MYAEVVLAKVVSNLDRAFHYSIPQGLNVSIGSEVLIPFGNRKIKGFVIGFVDKAEVTKIKDILEVTSTEPLFTEKQVELAKWIADYYCSFFSSALKLVMSPGGKNRECSSRACSAKIGGKASFAATQKLKLTEEQQKAVAAINAAVDVNMPETFLLHGITGSGKTEVYMQAIDHMLELGKSAIVLVPEISLTPQLVDRFEGRFGNQIASLHSHLTLKKRGQEWARIKSGEAKIVLGARSAIFAPVKNLGIIVIDEEYENSYKQDKNPRYHTREVAFFLAEQHKAVVVLGSATPTMETYYQAEIGNYKKLDLPQRIDSRPLPPVEIVDLRKKQGFLLSNRLREELKKTLEAGQQAILFINRRGFFTFVICQECGVAVECPHCSISLTYHSEDKQLHCNRCDYRASAPTICPQCNSTSLRYCGTGTQRIEQEVAQVYAKARVLRYDRDSVAKRGSHEEFFATFAEGKADVLIGTQMVAKGLDVANVTLVGVISADTALHLPDFRSAERTFQLITQVAGRAGRHHLPGKVIVQTYSPDHYAIVAATKHDFVAFYEQEIKHREELGYPPFSQLISFVVSGQNKQEAQQVASDLGKKLKEKFDREILGPAPAVIARLRGMWRYHILLKSSDLDKARNDVRQIIEKFEVPKEVRLIIDVQPMSLL